MPSRRYHSTSDESVVMVYRAKGDSNERLIRPRALSADATYAVTLQDAAQTTQLRGSQLMEYGVLVTLPEFASEIMVLVQVEGA